MRGPAHGVFGVPLAAAAIWLAGLTGCPPDLPNGRYSCDPADPRSCPVGTSCLSLGPEHRCYESWWHACDNGVVEPEEQCDGTNFAGGLPEDFGCDPGDNIYCLRSVCRVYCTQCGNRRVEVTPSGGGEQCDDGNASSGDGCSATCQLETCGNGTRDASQGEECDDGNIVPGDGCSPACRHEVCGNGLIDFETGEHCDDGNARSGDGCASDCTVEFPLWTRWTSRLEAPRHLHGLVHDVARNRLVLFGGFDGETALDDTWERVDGRWLRVPVAASPGPRRAHGLVYDSAQQRILCFGGAGASDQATNDLWAYDGTTWTRLSATPAPPPRLAFGVTYDHGRQQLVLFGGLGDQGGSLYNDTWVFDGVAWSQIFPATPPTRRGGQALAYDPLRDRVVLFGGADLNGQPLPGTWEFDGAEWHELSPIHQPPLRVFHTLSWHGGHGGVVAVGGFDYGTQVFDDAWLFDGVDWAPLAVDGTPIGRVEHAAAWDEAAGHLVIHGGRGLVDLADAWTLESSRWAPLPAVYTPPDRVDAAAAYDRHRGELVLFGGRDEAGLRGDTWTYDGETWMPQSASGGPSPRLFHGLAYDRRRHRVVLYGGWDGTGPRDDTWIWDSETGLWQELVTDGAPPPRYGHAVAYHPDRDRVVVFGGVGEGAYYRSDTWELDLDTGVWLEQDLAVFPPSRFQPAVTWDARRQALVLFGGYLPSAMYSDTWFYGDGEWRRLLSERAPSPRGRPLLGFDESRERPILFGGSESFGIPGENALGDTWELRDDGWHALAPVDSPAPRESMVGSWDRRRRRLVLVGGVPGITEVWEFRYHGFGGVEACDNGLDDDGDSLADCADPDCAPDPRCGAAP